jgi:hypothetical protein
MTSTEPPARRDAGPHLHVRDIMVACADVEAVASFWSALLARPVAARMGPYVWLERRDGVGLGFQAVAADSRAASYLEVLR